MRGKEFRARDKKVNKLSRDGLVEQNKATGEERRVSQRTADVSFGPERPAEPALGRTKRKQAQKSRSIISDLRTCQPPPGEASPEGGVEPPLDAPVLGDIQHPAESMQPEQDTPPAIRDTRASADRRPPKNSRRHKTHAKNGMVPGAKKLSEKPVAKRWQEAQQQSEGAVSEHDLPREQGDHGHLRFEANPVLDHAPAERKRRQPLMPDDENLPDIPGHGEEVPRQGDAKESPPQRDDNAGLRDDSVGPRGHTRQNRDPPVKEGLELTQPRRLQFEGEPVQPAKTERKKRRQPAYQEHRADQGAFAQQHETPRQSPAQDEHPPPRGTDANEPTSNDVVERSRQREVPSPGPSQSGQVRFENDPAQAADQVPDGSPVPPSRSERLRFEDVPTPEADAGPSRRQQRYYQKAERRVEQASSRLERAQEKLPAKRRAHLEAQYDSDAGKVRRRLQFEKEVIPEGTKPALPKRAGAAAVGTAKTAVVMKAHQKLREAEHDNTGVEAAHKFEFVAERGAGRFLRWNKDRLHSKPYRAVRQAQGRLQQEQTRLAWQTALRDNPELQRKNAISKWFQKQKIKRKYAQAAREAQKTAQHTQNILTTTGQIVRAAAQQAIAHKSALALIALLALVMLLFSSGLASCTAMLSGLQSSYIATAYMANEEDICESDLYYTELETVLQMDVDATETNYPGYDEYRYNIGEISHDPYELMGYLSAAYDAFPFEQVKAEIERLFGEQYTLTRTPVTETRYDEDNNPYDWTVLQTTLTVRSLSQIIAASLTPGDQTDRYGVYMQTYGNRQAYGNPFDFPWLAYVSSYYGWRVHPITGVKDLHRGVDIAVAQGTAIHAVQDGRVVSAGDAGNYGLCVVIEDDSGYQSRYAHCSGISVSAGQEIQRGDVIAAVGSTGNSTGPHLHLEVKLNGEYLNPLYFVETGGSGGNALPGTPGGVEIPAYPGEPVTDETYAAMLEEAQKYLGYPYVWGGSSPSTSFDCSGYVSWVINHSGWNVGRLGAQGLFNICTPVSAENAKPGDLIFFTKTYSTPNPVSHVGIYVGNGQMIHCGDPISYANINSSYWTQHFYSFGRLPT